MTTVRSRETAAAAATPDERVEQLLRRFDADAVCAAELLCDGHDPDAIAFTVAGATSGHVDLSYGELRGRSAALAAGFAAQGIGPGDRVATLMGKSEELVVTTPAGELELRGFSRPVRAFDVQSVGAARTPS